MLKINDILSLNKSTSSIRKIDQFLEVEGLFTDDYFKALVFKASIYEANNKLNDALEVLYSRVNDFDKISNSSVILVCDAIIDICLMVDRIDQAYKFVTIKKDHLSVSNSSLFVKDQIKIALKIEEYDKARIILEEYLQDDLSKEESLFAKIELAKIYFYQKDYDKYLEVIPLVEAYNKENLKIDEQNQIDFNKICIAFYKKNYIKVINLIKGFFKDCNDVGMQIKATTMLIRCYLEFGDLKKASIQESNVADIIGENYLDESIEFCYAALDLYNKMGAISSITQYNDKVRKLEAKKVPLIKSEPKKEKLKDNDYSNIVIPQIEELLDTKSTITFESPVERSTGITIKRDILNPVLPKKIVQTQEIVKEVSSKFNVKISKELSKIDSIFDSINTYNLSTKFRELYRVFSIELCKILPIDEIFIMYHTNHMHGIWYKKERAYDRDLNIDLIKDTLNYESYILNTELFLDEYDRKYNKNIVNTELFSDDIYGFSMPIHNNIDVIGSISFISKRKFLDEEYSYQLLHMLVNMMNTRLLIYLNQEKIESDNLRTFFIMDNLNMGIKEEMDGYIHFNDKASSILGSLDDITLDDFYYNMDLTDAQKYKDLRNKLIESKSVNESITYRYKKDSSIVYIKEVFYVIEQDGNIWLYSLIEDVTNEFNERNSLIDLAYKNPISKMFTEVKLDIDINSEIKSGNLGLCVFELRDFNLYRELYGYVFESQLMYAIGQELNNAMVNYFNYSAYQMGYNRYAILLKKISDRRIIARDVTNILKNVSKALKKLNKRLNVSFDAGYFRVANEDIRSDVMISNAIDAINDAQVLDIDTVRIAAFDSKASRIRFIENDLTTAISEAIDNNLIKLNYQQISDISTKRVFGYYINPSLDSYKVEYSKVLNIAKRKGLTKQLDKYIVIELIKEMKYVYDKLKGFLGVFVKLNKESIDDSFLNNLAKAIRYYKIDPKFLTIILDDIDINTTNKLKSLGINVGSLNVLNLFNTGINYMFYDYKLANFESIKEIRFLSEKSNARLILTNIDKEEEYSGSLREGYNLILGKYYNNQYRIEEIVSRITKKN